MSQAVRSTCTEITRDPHPQSSGNSIEIKEQDTLIEGRRMHSLVAGSGAPVVLVHGLLGAAASWQPAMRVLARRARVYAVDAIGIGSSERANENEMDATLVASSHRLALWLDAQRLRRVDLVGTSHGGAVAMCFASLYPERVRSLVLHAPANPFCLNSRPQIRLACTPLGRRLAQWLPAAPAFIHSMALTRMYGNPSRVRTGSLQEYVTSLRVPGTVEYILSVLRSWVSDMEALTPMLPRLRTMPTLLLWGALDRAVSLTSAHQLREILKAPMEVLPELGHLPFEEAPELFAEKVWNFLSGLTLEDASTLPMHRTA